MSRFISTLVTPRLWLSDREAPAEGHNQQPRRLQVYNLRVGCGLSNLDYILHMHFLKIKLVLPVD